MKMILLVLSLLISLNSSAELVEVEINGEIKTVDILERNDWFSCTPGQPVTKEKLSRQAKQYCSQTSYSQLYTVGAYDGVCKQGSFGMSRIQVYYFCTR